MSGPCAFDVGILYVFPTWAAKFPHEQKMVGRISRCLLGSSEENMMTQFPVNGKTLLYHKQCMVDVCILLNTNIKS